MALMSFREREVAWEIPTIVEYIELSGVEDFNDRFIGNLGLPPLDTLPDLDVPPSRRRDAPAQEATRMTRTGARIALIACGAVALDTAALVERHGWDADVHGISSDLHMTPLEIAPAVEEKLEKLLPDYDRVIVVYGDCGTGGRLDAVLERYPAVRPGGRPLLRVVRGRPVRAVPRDHRDLLPHGLARDQLGPGGDQGPRARPVPVDEGDLLRQPHARGVRAPASRPRPRGEGARDRRLHGASRSTIEDLGIEPLERLLAPLMEEDADAVRRLTTRPTS